jgi:hypothetical protein
VAERDASSLSQKTARLFDRDCLPVVFGAFDAKVGRHLPQELEHPDRIDLVRVDRDRLGGHVDLLLGVRFNPLEPCEHALHEVHLLIEVSRFDGEIDEVGLAGVDAKKRHTAHVAVADFLGAGL